LLPGAVLAMVVFAVSAFGLRIYIAGITSTGYTYGALATPIAFLLFAFLIGFAIVLGAQLNNAIQETWPIRPSRRRHRIQRLLGIRQAAEALGIAREPAPALTEPEAPVMPDALKPDALKPGSASAGPETSGSGTPDDESEVSANGGRRPQGRPARLNANPAGGLSGSAKRAGDVWTSYESPPAGIDS
jgi:membrane protein